MTGVTIFHSLCAQVFAVLSPSVKQCLNHCLLEFEPSFLLLSLSFPIDMLLYMSVFFPIPSYLTAVGIRLFGALLPPLVLVLALTVNLAAVPQFKKQNKTPT